VKTTGTATIEALFAGRPEAFTLFQVVREYIESIGPVRLEPSKTQVSFGTRTKFAWVWLPQMWIKKQPENSIVLTFGLRRRIEDRRIKESVEPYPGRFTHQVVIEKESDFDENVREWLREAYSAAQGKEPPLSRNIE